jgi:hypothetical protein
LELLDPRAQLWSSTDGVNWGLIDSDAFGETFTYGFRTMVATENGEVFVGGASNLFLPNVAESPYTDDVEGIIAGESMFEEEGLCDALDQIFEQDQLFVQGFPHVCIGQT